MARTKARTGKGTTLSIAPDVSGVAGTYVKVGELTSVRHPKVSVESTDATHYESDNGFYEDIPTGWKRGDDVPFALNYHKTEQATLLGYVGVEKWFKVTLPDGSTYVWFGHIKEFGGDEIDMKNTMRSSGVLKIGGEVDFTAAA